MNYSTIAINIVLFLYFSFNIPVLCSASAIDDDAKSGKFYIYPLDSQYQWKWPDRDANCSRHGQLNPVTHAENLGMGHVLDLTDGMLDTWHFSLFYSLMNRLRHSSRRTRNPQEASLFIIPYDMFLDGYFRPDCKLARACTGVSAMSVWSQIEAEPYFERSQGADHAVLWSGGQYHPWPRNGCDTLVAQKCKLCSVTCVWMDGGSPDNHFISIPFPTSYHWWDGIQQLPWDINSPIKRNMKVVYVGGSSTLNPDHTKIRKAVIAQCEAHPACKWLQVSHSATDSAIADFVRSYRRSVFCLCPPGDDPTRKALFDIIVSGCIPVVFHAQTIHNQYPWHIGEQVAKDISVYIPGKDVRLGNLDVMSILMKIDDSTIKRKQRAIADLAPKLQYSLPPLRMLQDISNEDIWDPAIRDGVDVMLDGMITRARRIARNESTGVPEHPMATREWMDKYRSVLT